MMKCDRCGGSGKLPIKIKDWYPGKPYPKCPDCHGTGTKPEPKRYKDGEPCNHPGCLSHLSHPCEGCGRIGGVKPEPEQDKIFDATKYVEWNTSVLIEEIHHMYNRIAGFKRKIKELGSSIEYRQRRIKELIKERRALKSEIESMRDTLKFIYEEYDWGHDPRIGESCLKHWKRKPK